MDVVAWVKKGVELGAGEILLTSVDQEGTRKGFDVALVRAVTDVVSIPVIASGGMGSAQHLLDVVREGHADAVAIADVAALPPHDLRRSAARVDQHGGARAQRGLGRRSSVVVVDYGMGNVLSVRRALRILRCLDGADRSP